MIRNQRSLKEDCKARYAVVRYKACAAIACYVVVVNVIGAPALGRETMLRGSNNKRFAPIAVKDGTEASPLGTRIGETEIPEANRQLDLARTELSLADEHNEHKPMGYAVAGSDQLQVDQPSGDSVSGSLFALRIEEQQLQLDEAIHDSESESLVDLPANEQHMRPGEAINDSESTTLVDLFINEDQLQLNQAVHDSESATLVDLPIAELPQLDSTIGVPSRGEDTQGQYDENFAADTQREVKVKPTFVFHFGPMKTATTTLQRDLKWSLQPFLEKDNWHYLEGDNPLHVLDQEPDYFEQFKKYADEYLARGTNIIMPKEQHSVLYNFHPEMYSQLYETLKDDWEVEFVVAYRPYLEWIPSLWTENYRWRDGRGWKKGHGEWDSVDAIFPGYWDWHATSGRIYTSHIVENASEFFPVKVFDMQDPRGVRTTFICDAIGEARVPAACEESRRLDKQTEKSKTDLNVGSTDEVHLDSVAIRLAAQGKINVEKFSRHDVLVATLSHVTNTLHQTPLDLPHICPSNDEYEMILKFTMEKEAKLLPELFNSEGREDELRRKLNKKMKKKSYCEIDVDALLQDESWAEFYSSFL